MAFISSTKNCPTASHNDVSVLTTFDPLGEITVVDLLSITA
jgi:hypothetical protein